MKGKLDGYSLNTKMRKLRRQYKLSATAQALYLELISICNESNWSNEFTCSNAELCAVLFISENYLLACRKELVQAGLLFYKSGKSKRQFGLYSFSFMSATTSPHAVKKPETTSPHGIVDNPTTSPHAVKKPETTSPHADYNKTKLNLINNINIRKKSFFKEVMDFEKKYSKEMLTRFFDYWSELNAKRTKMKFELQKTFEVRNRLVTWNSNDSNFKSNGNKNSTNGSSANGFSPKELALNNLIGN